MKFQTLVPLRSEPASPLGTRQKFSLSEQLCSDSSSTQYSWKPVLPIGANQTTLVRLYEMQGIENIGIVWENGRNKPRQSIPRRQKNLDYLWLGELCRD